MGVKVKFHEDTFYSITDPPITNSIVSLWFARSALVDETVILCNADVCYEEALLKKLLEDRRDNVMLCDSSRVEFGDYLFRVVNGRILNYGKRKVCYGANCEYVGLVVIRGYMIARFRERLEIMVQHQQYDYWWEQVLYSMSVEYPIWANDVVGNFWAEIDYIEDYQRILEYRKNAK
jgi:choline kinase